MTQREHYSVLLQESVESLLVEKSGVYVDGTFGRGGHSRMLLNKLNADARLIAFDKDPQAVAVGRQLEAEDARFAMVHASFRELGEILAARNIEGVHGVLLDLGVSSPQLDDAERGFSFLKSGPLDMRMDNSRGETAAQWLAHAEEHDIAYVLKEFGEERFARRMARAIVEARSQKLIETTDQLAAIVSAANPKWEKGKHPATRAFQAIRIYVNRELEDLQATLSQALNALLPGGRLVVISFHSLEDRIVKRFFKEQAQGQQFPPEVPVTDDMIRRRLTLIGKATKASDVEVEENVRSRSAVMRVAEKRE